MEGYISGVNFFELEAMKYYAPPASWGEEKKRENAKDKILSEEWYGARKRDGSFWKFVKDEDGNMKLLGRSKGVNGEYPNKLDWVPHMMPFFDTLPNGTCLLGEMYLPSAEGAKNTTTILGCLKDKAIARQNAGEKLHYYVFDILAFDGESWLTKPAKDRFDVVMMFQPKWDGIEFAKYVVGQELMDELSAIFAEGGEGIVITKGSAVYEPGKRPSKTTLKVKKEVMETIDCFFTGKALAPTRLYTGKEIELWKYWQNTRTGEMLPEGLHYHQYYDGEAIEPVTKPFYFGWAGSLEIGVIKDSKVTPIGTISGITDEMKAAGTDLKGRCIEVSCMEIFEGTNGLRHPKMLRFREDITIKDCTWEKIFG